MNNEWEVGPENIDIEEFKKQLTEEINGLDLNQTRRLAIGLGVVDPNEIVLEEKEGFKKKILSFMEKQTQASMLRVIKTKIRLAIEETKK